MCSLEKRVLHSIANQVMLTHLKGEVNAMIIAETMVCFPLYRK